LIIDYALTSYSQKMKISIKLKSSEPPEKMEKTKVKTKVKAKPTKKSAKPILETDPLYRFYSSLFRQNPKSEMANKWLIEHGCLEVVMASLSIS